MKLDWSNIIGGLLLGAILATLASSGEKFDLWLSMFLGFSTAWIAFLRTDNLKGEE